MEPADLSRGLLVLGRAVDLPRTGQYFRTGEAVCRIADTQELLVRIDVPEQALGDVAPGQSVRVKARAFPDTVFRGVVARIGAEVEQAGESQQTFRAELIIRNPEGMLRPGMAVFARIESGWRALGWIIAHKLKQHLRPEIWMF